MTLSINTRHLSANNFLEKEAISVEIEQGLLEAENGIDKSIESIELLDFRET